VPPAAQRKAVSRSEVYNPPMATNVFILGAGASREAGAPLMFDFLDTARDLLRSQRVTDSTSAFDTVFRGIAALQRVHSKSQLDANNIEAVFTAFEMAQIIRAFPEHTPDEILRLVPAMRVLITRTLEECIRFGIATDIRRAPAPYENLAELLVFLKQQAFPEQDSCVITFNYDLAIDFALAARDIAINYALADQLFVGAYPLLKLHGSLNWFTCDSCAIVAWNLASFAKNRLTNQEIQAKWAPIKLSALTSTFHNDPGHHIASEPVIVPPTWSKAEHHRLLATVWRRAAQELREAENIYVIGFSLPPTDEFFKYLYSLGTVGDTILRRFWVFDPEPSRSVEQRFRTLLGPGAQQRFMYFRETFGSAIGKIRNEYKVRMAPGYI